MREIPEVYFERFGGDVVHGEPVKAGHLFELAMQRRVQADNQGTSGHAFSWPEFSSFYW